MIVCICHKVTEGEIKQAVEQGVCGLKELRQQCQVGTQCGQCCRHAKSMIQEYRSELNETEYQAA